MTITNDENGIPNNAESDRTTLAPPTKQAERTILHTPDEAIGERDENVDEGRGHTTAE